MFVLSLVPSSVFRSFLGSFACKLGSQVSKEILTPAILSYLAATAAGDAAGDDRNRKGANPPRQTVRLAPEEQGAMRAYAERLMASGGAHVIVCMERCS